MAGFWVYFEHRFQRLLLILSIQNTSGVEMGSERKKEVNNGLGLTSGKSDLQLTETGRVYEEQIWGMN